MYDELIAELRQHHCDAKEDDTQEVCEECSYDVIIVDKSAPSGFASVCVCGLMNRAANVIEELSKPRWIPVSEKLPDENGNYLVSIKCPKGQWVEICSFYERDWLSTDEYAEIATKWVTHWMPLPEPPKEET